MDDALEVVLLAQAIRDFLEIHAEYEEQRAGRGEEFSQEVESVLTLLSRMPRLGRMVGGPYRRMKLSGFTRSLLYSVEGRRVFIRTVVSDHEDLEQVVRRLRR